jgi:putative colanic acid biosynthesis glycosyltransferase WcaI
MRILVYGSHFPPEPIGIGKFTGEMTAWLAKEGHEVRVVAAQPSYPGWRVMPGYAGARYHRRQWEGATVWHCPVWVPRRPTGVKRVLHYLSVAMSSAPIVFRQIAWKPAVIIVVVPPLFCSPVALLAARLSKARSWLHVQDFEVSAAFETGLLRQPALRRMASWVERHLMRRFDRVSTISPKMMEGLRARGLAEEQCTFFPNWVDVRAIYPLPERNVLREELGIPAGTTVALYSGNMAGKQGLETLLDAARLLEGEESLRFVMCGDGAAREKLRDVYGTLHNVVWLPLQPAERLNELLNLADIHLLIQLAGVADLVMPSKLTGMLASGRPVVATATPGSQVAEVVARCGVVVPPGDVGDLAAAVRALSADPGRRRRLGEAGRDYAVKNLDLSSVLESFERALISAANEPS